MERRGQRHAGIDSPLLRLTGTRLRCTSRGTNSPGAVKAAYLQDGIGSVVGVANPAGTLTANQRFDAWGNTLSSSCTTPTYGYTGREPDVTGLEFYRARYYHPGLGRFASRDPMGMADSVSPYAYVANNPINFVDPFGMEAALAGTTMNPAYWGMAVDAGGWLNNPLVRDTFATISNGAKVSVGNLIPDTFNGVASWTEQFLHRDQGSLGRMDQWVTVNNPIAQNVANDLRGVAAWDWR